VAALHARWIFRANCKPTYPNHLPDDSYVVKTDRRSSTVADLRRLARYAPTLLVTSSRDILLSGTTISTARCSALEMTRSS